MALYLLVNLALLRVLGPGGLAGQPVAMAAAVERLAGRHGADLVRGVAILSMIGAINACQLMASRIPVALGRDGLLPPAFARVNEGGTPAVGLWSSTAAAALFILTGSFTEVVAVMAFFFVANYVLAHVAVFVLRRREPAAPRPFRAWGYPLTTVLALLLSLAFLAGAVASDPRNSGRALLVLAASYPVYRLARRLGETWSRR
jgi:APA family basic amino acid/polyamine antiporter